MGKVKNKGRLMFNQAWMLAITARVLGPKCTPRECFAFSREIDELMHGVISAASLDEVTDEAFDEAKSIAEIFNRDLWTRFGLLDK